jgi:hypothetical protein
MGGGGGGEMCVGVRVDALSVDCHWGREGGEVLCKEETKSRHPALQYRRAGNLQKACTAFQQDDAA